MIYRIIYAPEAQDQLLKLHDYILSASSPEIAERYIDGIVSYCESLNIFPLRGMKRDDLRPGVRITHYKKRCVIAFKVFADQVLILGIFYGGQNYEVQFKDDLDD